MYTSGAYAPVGGVVHGVPPQLANSKSESMTGQVLADHAVVLGTFSEVKIPPHPVVPQSCLCSAMESSHGRFVYRGALVICALELLALKEPTQSFNLKPSSIPPISVVNRLDLIGHLVAARVPRTPVALRAAAAAGWRRRWWSIILSTAVQRALATTALGGPLYPQAAEDAPSLAAVLALAPQEGPSRMPLRVAA